MKNQLNHIATIQTGIFAKRISKGEVVYLQAKHFDEFGQLTAILHADLIREASIERHLLRDGDILFASKGNKNFATLYYANDLPAVASTSFFVIRLQGDYKGKVLPEFLVWFINQPATQRLLKGLAYGTAIVSISKSLLEVLEIPVPDISIQRAILSIADLRNQEKLLRQKIETLREQQIQEQINTALK